MSHGGALPGGRGVQRWNGAPAEQVFVHARRLREADETLIPRDPVGRNKGVPLLPPHLFNLMISVAASDPIAHAPRLVRAWRAAGLSRAAGGDLPALRRDDLRSRGAPHPHGRAHPQRRHGARHRPLGEASRSSENGSTRISGVTLTVGEASLATVSCTGRLVDEYDARGRQEPTERQLFRVPGREREIRIEPLRRTARLAASHFDIAAELWADSMAHGAVWQPTGSPFGGPEHETAVS